MVATPPSPHPGSTAPSPKRYATAVVLSAVLGFVGLQHFYLGRWAEGAIDVGLSVGWIVAFGAGELLLGAAFLVADGAHALATTILLLIGRFKDGEGRVVCYPGQRLPITRG